MKHRALYRWKHLTIKYRRILIHRLLQMKKCDHNIYIYVYLLIAIEFTHGGSSTVHIYTHTIHRTTRLTNWEEGGPCPVFAFYTLAFALHLRKKHGNHSLRCILICSLLWMKTPDHEIQNSWQGRYTTNSITSTQVHVSRHIYISYYLPFHRDTS